MYNNNVIYAYKKIDENKIVYVGQTINLSYRHKQHTEYDPYNKFNKEYNYPLSRGIRKYGASAYELVILEDNLLQSELDEKEKYWIKYYDTYFHGYNQTIGGSNPTFPVFDEKVIDLIIEMLQDYDSSFQDICEKTGVSITHIYNINTGNRRKRDNISYPIRPSNAKGTKGLKFSSEENQQIHNLLLNSPKEMKQIAKQFNCEVATISRINKGETKAYRTEGYNYPLRKK